MYGTDSDLRVLYNLAFTRVRGATHGERLDSFYRAQAGDYDAFRRRLLHGREEMMAALEIPEGGKMLDVGGGTGYNAELLGDRLARLQSLRIIDLCPSLLGDGRRAHPRQRLDERADDARRRHHLRAAGRAGGRGDVFVFADDDSELVSGAGAAPTPPSSRAA